MATFVTQHLHRAVRHHPDRIATISSDRRRTYRELGERVARFASALRNLGVGKNDRVAILAHNSDRYMEAFLGTYWAGGVVNLVNTRWSSAEINFSLGDCTSNVLIVDDSFLEFGQEFLESSSHHAHVICIGEKPSLSGTLSFEALIADAEPTDDACRQGNDLAAIYYTGGTTGFPKGVMISHDAANAATVNRLTLGCGPGSVALHAAPLFHLAGSLALFAQLAVGGTNVFIPRFDARAFMELVQSEKVTDTLIVPTMIQLVLDHPNRKDFDLSSLQRMVYGGSAISETLLRRLMIDLPGLRLIQGYGQTELSGCVTFLPPKFHVAGEAQSGKLASAGYAATLSEVKIVDADGGELERGKVGEIAVRSATAMLGYWNRPEETAAVMRDGWIYTGDMAYMDDEGFIFIVDRLKDMIVSGGENVYSAEVESAILKHPGVSSCVVIGIPSDKWGESVHAVVIKSEPALTDGELMEHCHSLIAGYKCPRSVEFVSELPISATGKLQKQEIRKKYWHGRSRNVG